jgi:hypothetical protein
MRITSPRGPYFLLFEEGAKRIGVIAFVGQEFLDAGDQADAFLRHDAIGGVARRQDQHPPAEKRIDDRVDFAVAAAFRESDRLKFGPLFRRWCSGEPGHGGYPTRLVSAARTAPQPPRISSARCPARSSGQSDCRSSCGDRTPSGIAPATANFQHMHDPAQNQPIVFAFRSWLVCR